MGRCRNTLQKEDIRQQHFRLSDTQSMVGVYLMASWQQTRKLNNNELIPLVSRPFSLNSYCLIKVWFRTHSVGACKS